MNDVVCCSHETVLISLLVLLYKALCHLPQFLSQYLQPVVISVSIIMFSSFSIYSLSLLCVHLDTEVSQFLPVLCIMY